MSDHDDAAGLTEVQETPFKVLYEVCVKDREELAAMLSKTIMDVRARAEKAEAETAEIRLENAAFNDQIKTLIDRVAQAEADLATARAEAAFWKADDERLANLLKTTRSANLVDMTADRDSWLQQADMAQSLVGRVLDERDAARAEAARYASERDAALAVGLQGKLCISTQHDNLKAERDSARKALDEARGLLLYVWEWLTEQRFDSQSELIGKVDDFLHAESTAHPAPEDKQA